MINFIVRGARGGNRTRVTSLEGWGNEPLYDTRVREQTNFRNILAAVNFFW